jgi:hypothetical protein
MSRSRTLVVLAVVAALACWGAAGAATAAPAPAADQSASTAADVQQQEGNATVTFDNQTAANDTVTVGSVVGVSEYLEPGTHENVTVTLYADVPGATFENESLQSSQVLVAMPHEETTGDEAYDFVASNGSDDGPYVVDGEAVVDSSTVVLVDDAGGGDDETET